jgi:uncharacterized MAPEG superfamily protein
MTIALYCILVAALMPIMWTGIAKFSGPGFNNRTPRNFQERLTGVRQRAHWAHLNSLEALPPFAAAVLVSHVVNGASSSADYLALTWVACRVLYGVLYLVDQATLRSLAWAAATACWIALFFVG